MISLQVPSLQARGGVPNCEAPMVKLFSGEPSLRSVNFAVDLLGPRGLLRRASGGREVAEGRMARYSCGVLPTTIAGGTSENQRGIIATGGLGLPRG